MAGVRPFEVSIERSRHIDATALPQVRIHLQSVDSCACTFNGRAFAGEALSLKAQQISSSAFLDIRAHLVRVLPSSLSSGMSQRTVELIIGRLLTDEDLRHRFGKDPVQTLASLCDLGYELSHIEINALVSTDPALWPRTANHIHPSLQRCTLHPE